MKNRNNELDAIKGLLISFIVIGHVYKFAGHYVEWFHVPLFFAVSGYLIPLFENSIECRAYVLKRAQKLFIPYITYYFVIRILLMRVFDKEEILWFLLFGSGGKSLTGVVGVWWFISCLYLSTALYILLEQIFKNQLFLSLVIFAIVGISYVATQYMRSVGYEGLHYIPWSINTSGVCLAYIYIGRKIRKNANQVKKIISNNSVVAISIILICVTICLDVCGIMTVTIGMKASEYGNSLILLLSLPVLFGVAILFIIKHLNDKIIMCFALIGRSSLQIMYTHLVVVYALNQILVSEVLSRILSLILSIALGCIIKIISNRSRVLHILLG